MTERPNIPIILTERAVAKLRAPSSHAIATIVGPFPDGEYSAEHITIDGQDWGGSICMNQPTGAYEVCYLAQHPNSAKMQNVLAGEPVTERAVTDYIFRTPQAAADHLIANDCPSPDGYLIVEYTMFPVSEDRNVRQLLSNRIVGRTVVKDGKIGVAS